MGARTVVFATRTLVPITTFANLSDSCALAEDNGQTFHSLTASATPTTIVTAQCAGQTLLGKPIATEMGR